MAKFEFYVNPDAPGFILDCQADVLAGLNTRFVVPVMPIDIAPFAGAKLNPIFDIEGERYSMVTQFAGSVPVTALGRPSGSLRDHEFAVGNAIDMLLSGY